VARREIGLVAGYAISLIGGVLSLVMYAHMLGPTDYGRLAVYLALVEALQGVLFQWHRLAVVKFWAVNEKSDFASYLKTYHLIWLGLACSVLVILGFAQFVGGKPLDVEWPAVIAMGIGKSAALYAQEIARAAGASLRYAFGALCMTIGSALAGVVAYQMTHSITAIMLASTAVFSASSVVCGCRVGIASAGGRFSRQHFQSMLRYGLPLVPVFLAATALTRLDRPILAQFEVPAVVGVYAAATALISNMIAAGCLLVVTPAYPWLLREKERLPDAEYRRLHAQVGLLMLGCVLAVSITLYTARGVLLPLLLGKEIGNAAQGYVLPLLVISLIGAFRAHFFDQAYHLFSKTRALMAINLATLAVAVTALYLGARWGGLKGLLYGLLAANMLSIIASATVAKSFVNLGQLSNGIALLALISIASMTSAMLFEKLFLANMPSVSLCGLLSASVAMLVFSGSAYIANVGSVRILISKGL
jgi:O-antigen/teichoic acid export membrane protein